VPSFKSVAVWKYRPVAKLPVVLKLGAGLNNSALDRAPPPPNPPEISTDPFCSNVAVCVVRAVFNVAETTLKVPPEKLSALFRNVYPAELPDLPPMA
jgi:hypothetical protein